MFRTHLTRFPNPQGPWSPLFRWQQSAICLSPRLLFVSLLFESPLRRSASLLPPAAPASPSVPYSTVVTGLEELSLLLYPLLAVSLVLLFSSLSLALVVFLRSSRTQAVNSQSKESEHGQGCVAQLCQEGSPSG